MSGQRGAHRRAAPRPGLHALVLHCKVRDVRGHLPAAAAAACCIQGCMRQQGSSVHLKCPPAQAGARPCHHWKGDQRWLPYTISFPKGCKTCLPAIPTRRGVHSCPTTAIGSSYLRLISAPAACIPAGPPQSAELACCRSSGSTKLPRLPDKSTQGERALVMPLWQRFPVPLRQLQITVIPYSAFK